MKHKSFLLMLSLGLFWPQSQASAQTVKIMSLGSRTGEFCELDRTLLFEDPSGVRILYDPGFTVAGGTDARLGDIHAILLSHAHLDHIGDAKLNQDPDSGSARCTGLTGAAQVGAPPFIPAPKTNLAEIAAGKNSAVIVGRLMATFIAGKIQTIRRAPTPACPAAAPGTPQGASDIVVPRPSPCTANLDFGGKRTVTLSPGRVQVALVPAHHENNVNPTLLVDPLRTDLVNNGLAASVGLSTGYVLTFSNGLSVYLSGDTGITSEMETVVNRFHRVNLAVVNFDDGTTKMGPDEAAFAVSQLIKPKVVIPLHMNEVAPGPRTVRFASLLLPYRIPVLVPKSGVIMEFDGNVDGNGNCVGRCR